MSEEKPSIEDRMKMCLTLKYPVEYLIKQEEVDRLVASARVDGNQETTLQPRHRVLFLCSDCPADGYRPGLVHRAHRRKGGVYEIRIGRDTCVDAARNEIYRILPAPRSAKEGSKRVKKGGRTRVVEEEEEEEKGDEVQRRVGKVEVGFGALEGTVLSRDHLLKCLFPEHQSLYIQAGRAGLDPRIMANAKGQFNWNATVASAATGDSLVLAYPARLDGICRGAGLSLEGALGLAMMDPDERDAWVKFPLGKKENMMLLQLYLAVDQALRAEQGENQGAEGGEGERGE